LELLRPENVPNTVASLGNGSVGIAGGTDLVPLLRDRIVEATTLVDLSRAVPRGVGEGRIGAGTTLAELEADPQIPEALREACRLAASPQLRAMGTLAGNLRQATRCWYWRLKYPCYLHGGDRCHAREGEHREHAVFANAQCASAHPSDVAAALLALDARILTSRRDFGIVDLYRLPTHDDRDLVALAPDELILEIELAAPDASTYLKAMDRRRWAFPLVGVAAARFGDEVRFGLAGVAPIPWQVAGEQELEEATPLPGTAYKVDIARALIRRAAAAVAA
jgi:xanthine dehydrogenase YagS FAD-binding subunit